MTKLSHILIIAVFIFIPFQSCSDKPSSEPEEPTEWSFSAGENSIETDDGTIVFDTPCDIDVAIVEDESTVPEGSKVTPIEVTGDLGDGETATISITADTAFADSDALAYVDTYGNWRTVYSTLSSDGMTLSAEVNHFSTWGVTTAYRLKSVNIDGTVFGFTFKNIQYIYIDNNSCRINIDNSYFIISRNNGNFISGYQCYSNDDTYLGSVSYEYENNQKISVVSSDISEIELAKIVYIYDDYGVLIKSDSYISDVLVSSSIYEYDSLGQLLSVSSTILNSEIDISTGYVCTYENGNITHFETIDDSQNIETFTYAYDELGQIDNANSNETSSIIEYEWETGISMEFYDTLISISQDVSPGIVLMMLVQ